MNGKGEKMDYLHDPQLIIRPFSAGDRPLVVDFFANLGEEYGNTTATIRNQMVEIGEQSIRISQEISDIDVSVREISESVATTAKRANELALSTNGIADSLKDLNDSSEKNVANSLQLSEQINNYIF